MGDEFSKSSGARVRLIVLVVLLLIVGGAFAYDYLVPKAAFTKAWNDIQEMEQSGSTKTSAEIRKMFDREPSEIDEDSHEGAAVERYSWMRGLPFSTFDIYVVYSTDNLDKAWYYYSASANEEPTSFPQKTPSIVRPNEESGTPAQVGSGADTDNPGDDNPDDGSQDEDASQDDNAAEDSGSGDDNDGTDDPS